MNVRLDVRDLDPKDQRDLEALAEAEGKDAKLLLRELVHEAIEGRKINGRSPAPRTSEQEAAWSEFLAGTAEWSKHLPPGHIVDDSRESIYAGRGE